MPKYLITRPMPGVGSLSADELRGAARTSNAVLRELGPDVQWVHSYVVDDAVNCVYIATGEELIREHARRSGFPCETITRVETVIDPTTAEA